MTTEQHNPFATPQATVKQQVVLSVGDRQFAGFWIRA